MGRCCKVILRVDRTALYSKPELVKLFDQIENVEFWIKDVHGRFIWVNLPLLVNFGLQKRSQVIGRTDFDIADATLANQTAAGVRAEMILGAKDAMTPPKAAKALAEMLGARVQTLPAGHSLMTEAPEGMLNALKAALA